MSQRIFVAVAGNIGAGKTTLANILAKKFNWVPHYESVEDNPYLQDFYEDMVRWSFPLQVFFLNNRFKAHQKIITGTESSIQDRCIYEDANIFARNLLDEGKMQKRDYDNYLELYTSMCQYLDPPDLVIFLKKSLPRLRERIIQRGRAYEKSIPDQYLSHLNHYYDDWMQRYDLGKKLVIQADDLDFVNNPNHFNWLCHEVVTKLDQKDLFLEQSMIKTA